jgi:hypothetical protein
VGNRGERGAGQHRCGEGEAEPGRGRDGHCVLPSCGWRYA